MDKSKRKKSGKLQKTMNQMTVENGEYIGSFSKQNNQIIPDGIGKLIYQSGDTYEGLFEDGIKVGTGKYTWAGKYNFISVCIFFFYFFFECILVLFFVGIECFCWFFVGLNVFLWGAMVFLDFLGCLLLCFCICITVCCLLE